MPNNKIHLLTDEVEIPEVLLEFHRHLGACARCRESPHDLCSEGGSVLQETVDLLFVAENGTLQGTASTPVAGRTRA